MSAREKNDILMAHMFLSVPAFMEKQIERYPRILSPKAALPEFWDQKAKGPLSVDKGSATQPTEKGHSSQAKSPANSGVPLQKDWFVHNGASQIGPLEFSEAVSVVLQIKEDALVVKSRRLQRELHKEYLLKEFHNFTSQLEQHLLASARQATLKHQTTLEEDVFQSPKLGAQQSLESESNLLTESRKDTSLKKGSGATIHSRTFDTNPYMSNNVYMTAFEGKPDEFFNLPEDTFLHGRHRKPATAPQFDELKSEAEAQPKAQTTQSHRVVARPQVQEEVYSNSQDDGEESILSGKKSMPHEKSYSPNQLSAILEDYKQQSFNLDEIFSLCEGASQFFSKIKQDNVRFHDGEGSGREQWPAEPTRLPPPRPPAMRSPAPPGGFSEGRVFTPADFKSQSSAGVSMNFNNLVESSKINVRSNQDPRNAYPMMPPDFSHPREQEPPRKKPEKPMPAFQGQRVYPGPQDYYASGYATNAVYEDSYDNPSTNSFHSSSAHNSRGNIYPHERIESGPTVPKGRGQPQPKRAPAQPFYPEDFSSDYPPSKFPGPHPGHPGPRQPPIKNANTSNPYVNSHYEMNNLDYQSQNPYRSQAFGSNDPFFDDADSNSKSNSKPQGNIPMAGRSHKPQKSYTKRS